MRRVRSSPENVPRRRTGSIATQKEMATSQHAPFEGAAGTRWSVPVASTRTGLAIRWTELCPSRVTDTAAQRWSRKANQPVQYTGPVAKLRVDVYLETQYRMRVKVLHCIYCKHESIHV